MKGWVRAYETRPDQTHTIMAIEPHMAYDGRMRKEGSCQHFDVKVIRHSQCQAGIWELQT